MAQFEPKQKGAILLRLFQNLALARGTFWPKLVAHFEPFYPPDNNLAENAIRPLAVGRKGYLFCGNHESAENAAIMYSLLGCCKACDVNPREWLTDVFSKIALYNNNYELDLADLLPHNWKLSNKCQNFPKDSN